MTRFALISAHKRTIAAHFWKAAGGVALGTLCGLTAVTAPAAAQTNPRLSMVVENRGTVVMELFPKDAPKTVAHILELVNKKFYDGIKIHRVDPGFVIQAGDPKSKNAPIEKFKELGIGSHGSGKTVPLEATLPHDRGTLGMARTDDPNSGDSQFFVNLSPNHNLDNDYTVFGRVTQGMNVVDKIRKGDRIKSLRVISAKPKKK